MSGRTACFDVFDTVLTRRVGEPAGVFLLVGRAAQARGLITVSPAEFAATRSRAEADCRAQSATGETTLREICDRLTQSLGQTPALATRLIELELAAESSVICPVPGALEKLAMARRESPRLLFASDMYLPGDFLRAQLAAHDCWREGDHLYVSHEEGWAKSNGLFGVILEREKLAAGDLGHTGNHFKADYTAPAALGIAATLDTAANLNRYEQGLETFASFTDGLASVHAGTSRLARLSVATETPAQAAIRDVAAGVAGPVLVSYVSWVLRTARERSVARLYFVARDGFLLLQLARQLAPRLHPGAELRYLHGSRQAWHLPGVFSIGEAELSWLFCPTDFLSVASLLARVDFSGEELAAPLVAAGFPPERWSRNLSMGERHRLRHLIQDPAIAGLIGERAAAARTTLLAYLRQEGLLAPGPCALVDVGWHGRAHDSLAKVIRAAGSPAPEGFYFRLNSTRESAELGARHAWFFNRPAGMGTERALPGLEPLLEVFCTADHGVTTGYQQTAHGIEPALRPASAALRAWGWATLQQTLAEYGRHFFAAPVTTTDEDSIRAMCLASLRLFLESPTAAEAEAWGAFPYEDDQGGAHVAPLAASLPWGQLAGVLWHGRSGPHRAAWWAGSLQLTPPVRRSVLRTAQALRQWARGIKRGFA